MGNVSLKEYTDSAVKLLSKFGKPWMLKDDENISIVIDYLYNADVKYVAGKGASLNTFRFRAFLMALKRIMYTKSRCKEFAVNDIEFYQNNDRLQPSSLDIAIQKEEEESQQIQVDSILNHPILSKKEKKYLYDIYFMGLNQSEVAKKYKVCRGTISISKLEALEKLRGVLNVKKEASNKEECTQNNSNI